MTAEELGFVLGGIAVGALFQIRHVLGKILTELEKVNRRNGDAG